MINGNSVNKENRESQFNSPECGINNIKLGPNDIKSDFFNGITP